MTTKYDRKPGEVQKASFNFKMFCLKILFTLFYTSLGVLNFKSQKLYLRNIAQEMETTLENNFFSAIYFSIGNY